MPALRRSPKVEAAELSPERTALADAIVYVTELRAQLLATHTAIDTAQPAVWAAIEALDAAPEVVERAKANAAIYLQEQARGLSPVPPQTIREARNLVADAQDALDAARAAMTALEAERASLQSRMPMAEEAVRRAARRVLHAEAETFACALAAELAEMQRAMVALGDTVEWLAGAGAFAVVERPGGSYGRPEDEAIRMALSRLHTPPETWRGLARARPDPIAAGWVAAYAALQADATAPLPVVPAP